MKVHLLAQISGVLCNVANYEAVTLRHRRVTCLRCKAAIRAKAERERRTDAGNGRAS